jgi:acetylornithine aminotransferase/acetylornithine/N-succinyldiaminopimelate aminotransferase
MTDSDNVAISALEDRFAIATYAKWPVAFVRGEGCRLWDADGTEYLDLYGGHCTTLLGHAHPHWVGAIAAQAALLPFYSNVAANDVRARYLERMVGFAPGHLERAFLCNSGAEANETAVKLAMQATGRTRIVAMADGFHGRTAGALSLTHLGVYRTQFPAIVREVPAAPFGDLDRLTALLDDDTAAVILEPIQSMAGVRVADDAFYPALIETCHANGTLVIFDEVQTGMGRLGAPFAADLWDAPADLITSAKGIGNGFPMAAVMATEAVADTVSVGDHGTTFGGGPLACAAGLAVLEVIDHDDLVGHAAAMERFARSNLITGPVTGISGRGLLLGLETSVPAREVSRYLFDCGVLVGTSADPNVLRLLPPLVVHEEDLARLAAELDRFPGGS